MAKLQNRQVMSKYGKVVSLGEHYDYLVEYFDEHRAKALELTGKDSDLGRFILNMGIVMVLNPSKKKDIRLGLREGDHTILADASEIDFKVSHWSGESSSIYDTPEIKDWSMDFGIIKDLILETIVTDYFYPKFIKRPKLLTKFIEWLVTEGLKWDVESRDKYGSIDLLIAQYAVPSDFTLFMGVKVLVVVGTQRQLNRDLAGAIDKQRPDQLFVISIDGSQGAVNSMLLKYGSGDSVNISKVDSWSKSNLMFTFFLHFRDLAEYISLVVGLNTRNTYLLGDLLSITVGSQHELITELRKLPIGEGRPFEVTLKKVIDFCFKDEFDSYRCDEQVKDHTGESRKDFVIFNDSPRGTFWKNRSTHDHAMMILLEAKNYQKPLTLHDLSQTQAYLVNNKHFGGFAIILSRSGYTNTSRLTSISNQAHSQRIIILDEDDLVKMIEMKSSFKSPSDLLTDKYRQLIRQA